MECCIVSICPPEPFSFCLYTAVCPEILACMFSGFQVGSVYGGTEEKVWEREKDQIFISWLPCCKVTLGWLRTSTSFTQLFPFRFWKLLSSLLSWGLGEVTAPIVLVLGFLWFLYILPTHFLKSSFLNKSYSNKPNLSVPTHWDPDWNTWLPLILEIYWVSCGKT